MIAKECGYSTATVSKALNGALDISAETTQYIRPRLTALKQKGAAAADELAKAMEEGRLCIPERIVVPGCCVLGMISC